MPNGATSGARATPLRRAGDAVAASWRGSPLHGWVLGLLIAAALLRIAVMVLYQPSVFQWIDAGRLARVGDYSPLFVDFWMPAGYGAFAIVLRALVDHVWFLIAAQHLLGLGTGLALFGAAQRLGAPRALALVPAVVVWFGGDYLYLEHLVMTDSFYVFVTSLGVYASARAVTAPDSGRWWAAAGAGLLAASLVRSSGLVLPLVLAAWTVVFLPRPLLARVRSAGVMLATTAGGVLVYVVVANSFGSYPGLNEMSGLNLYSRVAPIADCSRFTPPEGTRVLCERRDPDERPGTFFYAWDPANPAWRAFGSPSPSSAERAGPWARAVILHQPFDYAWMVVKDLARHIDPDLVAPRPYNGTAMSTMLFGYRDRAVEASVVDDLDEAYARPSVRVSAQKLLATYQRTTRVERLAMIGLIALTVLGMAFGRSVARRNTVLLAGMSFALYLVPVMVLAYDPRYGLPGQALLAAAAALGTTALLARFRAHRTNEPTAFA